MNGYRLFGGADVNFAKKNGPTPLYGVANSVSLEACKYLISVGADVNKSAYKLQWQYTSFKCHAGDGGGPLYYAALNCNVELCQCLLEGVDVDVEANVLRGFTPLHIAACKGHLDTVKHLISVGGVISKNNNDGKTPKQVARKIYMIQYLKSVEEEREEVARRFKRARIEDDDDEEEEENNDEE